MRLHTRAQELKRKIDMNPFLMRFLTGILPYVKFLSQQMKKTRFVFNVSIFIFLMFQCFFFFFFWRWPTRERESYGSFRHGYFFMWDSSVHFSDFTNQTCSRRFWLIIQNKLLKMEWYVSRGVQQTADCLMYAPAMEAQWVVWMVVFLGVGVQFRYNVPNEYALRKLTQLSS